MRLTTAEQAGIISAISIFLGGQKAELRLYGSRVKDHLKGGDIDLLLIVSAENMKRQLLLQKPEILAAITDALDDRRIDLKIATASELKIDPFLKIIFPQSIVLCTFLI